MRCRSGSAARACPLALAAVLAALAGCAPRGPEPDGHVPPLHPVRGQVLLGAEPAAGGVLSFTPDPPIADVVVQAAVGPDGRFEVTTVDTRSPDGTRAPGAPEGTYRVAFLPAAGGHGATPVQAPRPVRVSAGPNDVTVRLPAPAP